MMFVRIILKIVVYASQKNTHYVSITEINWLILFSEIIVAYSENYTKSISTLSEQNEC
jgi:uncharacterized membrane protein